MCKDYSWIGLPAEAHINTALKDLRRESVFTLTDGSCFSLYLAVSPNSLSASFTSSDVAVNMTTGELLSKERLFPHLIIPYVNVRRGLIKPCSDQCLSLGQIRTDSGKEHFNWHTHRPASPGGCFIATGVLERSL